MTAGKTPLNRPCSGARSLSMNTVRIVISPSTMNPKGFAATVYRTGNDGCTWQRGGTSHADSHKHAEQDARRWLLHNGEDEQATVLTTINPSILEDARQIGALLDASLPVPVGTERIAA